MHQQIKKLSNISYSDVWEPKGFKNLYFVKLGNKKENSTVFAIFNDVGNLAPPLVVLPYVRTPRAVVESMLENWILGKSGMGWMTSNVFFEYFPNDFHQ